MPQRMLGKRGLRTLVYLVGVREDIREVRRDYNEDLTLLKKDLNESMEDIKSGIKKWIGDAFE